MPEQDIAELQKLLLDNLELIDRISGAVCRRHAVAPDEAKDFSAAVRLKILDNDYAVLRKFSGKSSLSTYLTTVVTNHFLDYRVKKWGKWRPTVAAKRLGATALQLEALLYRDGRSADDAVRILRENLGASESEVQLHELAAKLPPRSKRHFETDIGLDRMPASEVAEDTMERNQRRTALGSLQTALNEAMRELQDEDRLILQMRYDEGLTVAHIARVLDQPQRQLYTRIERNLDSLRRSLKGSGLDSGVVLDLVGWEENELQIDFDEPG